MDFMTNLCAVMCKEKKCRTFFCCVEFCYATVFVVDTKRCYSLSSIHEKGPKLKYQENL